MATELMCFPSLSSSSSTHKTTRFPLNKHSFIQTTSLANPKPLRLTCAVSTHDTQLSENRRSANYQPDAWNYNFIQSLENNLAVETLQERAAKLEEEVRRMLKRVDVEPLTTLELIDNVQRLGLSYKFQGDINIALERTVSLGYLNLETVKDHLHATALTFRLLRQNGFDVSQDVFKSFKDNDGNMFKAEISNDVKGMLSLYEASHLAFEGESLLDEAKTFSRKQLGTLKERVGANLSEQISRALELPYHRRVHRLEARWYIDAYEKMEGNNRSLLELAKLDFNMVQSLYQRELRDMTRWWKEIDLASKLSFARDRLMECFFWSFGMIPEIHFSKARKELTKVMSLILVLDDVYDVYGTLDELRLFTNAVDRWDVNVINTLPDYMKLCFMVLYNTVNDLAYDTLKKHGVNSLPYLTKAWVDLLKAFLQEAKWTNDKVVPGFKEYLQNAWVSSSGGVLLAHSYFLVSPDITEQALDSLSNYHDLLRSPSTVFRVCNDLATSIDEIERGETTNSIATYMREGGVYEDKAREYLRSQIDTAWKKMNQDRVMDSTFPKPFTETAINLARISQCTYQHGDGFGRPDSRSNDKIKLLMMEPIPVNAA